MISQDDSGITGGPTPSQSQAPQSGSLAAADDDHNSAPDEKKRDSLPTEQHTATATTGLAKLPPLAASADDLQQIKKAVEDAPSVSGGLWLSSYLFVLFYFAVAAGAVTHSDLFLENPVKLPFLNI